MLVKEAWRAGLMMLPSVCFYKRGEGRGGEGMEEEGEGEERGEEEIGRAHV